MSHPQQPPPPYQPGPAAPQPPAKKRKKWPFIVGGLVALIVIISVANGGKTDKTEPTTPAAAAPTQDTPAPAAPPTQEAKKPASRVVVYEVTGAGQALNITYTTDGMTSSEQVAAAALPWTKQLELPAGQALQVVSVVAQAGDGTPEIAAKITVDGKVVKEGKSSGQFAVVTVSENIGSLGN